MAGGRGHVVEYAGDAVRAMPIEQRMTLCNLNIEMGGRSGFVAPDDATFAWIAGRPFAPQGAMWDRALAHWRTLKSDDDAAFDRDIALDCARSSRRSPGAPTRARSLGISGRVPDPAARRSGRRAAMESALAYMGLQPGHGARRPAGRSACSSAPAPMRALPDLKPPPTWCAAARSRRAWSALVVPGSTTVKREAEAEGLDKVFRDAGFFWGESGCSMCAGGNGDRGEPGERIVSTTNRNFENRQGPKVRTHLVSPATAAASRHRRPHRRRAAVVGNA